MLEVCLSGPITMAERKFAQRGVPVFTYIFTQHFNYVIPGSSYTIGAAHATEIVHKFNNVRDTPQHPEDKGLGNPGIVGTEPGRFASAHNMSEMWTTFACTSHPSATRQPFWSTT